MTTRNKATFLQELDKHLKALPAEERENALVYYDEYISEAGPDNEETTIAGLGSPLEVAINLKADYVVKEMPKTPRKMWNNLWLIVLAILSLPMTLPMTLTIVVLLFVPFIIIGSIVFAFGVAGITMVGAGLYVLFYRSFTLLPDFWAFMLDIGSALVSIGLGILFSLFTWFILKAVIVMLLPWLSKGLKKLAKKIKA